MPFSFERPAVGRERWVVAGLAVGVLTWVGAEIVIDYRPEKLSIAFMLAALGPLIALHELGHAAMSHSLGWRVYRVVIGSGRPLLRFRWGETLVDVRWLPVGGYVLPGPVELRRPRSENALIYLAGPGAELLLALLLIAVVGQDRVFTPTTSVGLIGVQSVLVVIALHLLFNLLPLPGMDDEAVSDGLGALRSPFLPRWHFVESLALPWLLRARDTKDPAARVELLREGIRQQPDNPFLYLQLGDALKEAGDPYEARYYRLKALECPDLSPDLESELRRRLGLQPD